MSRPLHHKIFTRTPSCLSNERMMAYHQDRLPVGERHQVEKHLLECELCSDAMEGFALFPLAGADMEELNEEVLELIQADDPSKRGWGRYLIAASLAALIGLSVFFVMNADKESLQPQLAGKQENTASDEIRNEFKASPAETEVMPVSGNGDAELDALNDDEDLKDVRYQQSLAHTSAGQSSDDKGLGDKVERKKNVVEKQDKTIAFSAIVTEEETARESDLPADDFYKTFTASEDTEEAKNKAKDNDGDRLAENERRYDGNGEIQPESKVTGSVTTEVKSVETELREQRTELSQTVMLSSEKSSRAAGKLSKSRSRTTKADNSPDFIPAQEESRQQPAQSPAVMAGSLAKETADSAFSGEVVQKTDEEAYYLYDYRVKDYSGIYKGEDQKKELDWIEGTPAKYEIKPSEKAKREESAETITRTITYESVLEEGMLKFKNNDFVGAIEKFDLILNNFPDDQNALFYSGQAYDKLNKPDKAIVYYDKILAGSDKDFREDARYHKGLALVREEKRESAKEVFRSIIEEQGYYKRKAEIQLESLEK